MVGPDANIWFGCVLRADDEPIIVGKGSNVQDGCVLHIDPGNPLIIGARVTIGHGAIQNSRSRAGPRPPAAGGGCESAASTPSNDRTNNIRL